MEYLDRCKPHTIGELFDIMQEYLKSNRGRRRTLKKLNQEKKSKNKLMVTTEALVCRPVEAAEPETCEHSVWRPRAQSFSWPIQQRWKKWKWRPRAGRVENTISLFPR
jgi:hypothetical protein